MRRNLAGPVALALWLVGTVAVAAPLVLAARSVGGGVFDEGAFSVALMVGFTG